MNFFKLKALMVVIALGLTGCASFTTYESSIPNNFTLEAGDLGEKSFFISRKLFAHFWWLKPNETYTCIHTDKHYQGGIRFVEANQSKSIGLPFNQINFIEVTLNYSYGRDTTLIRSRLAYKHEAGSTYRLLYINDEKLNARGVEMTATNRQGKVSKVPLMDWDYCN